MAKKLRSTKPCLAIVGQATLNGASGHHHETTASSPIIISRRRTTDNDGLQGSCARAPMAGYIRRHLATTYFQTHTPPRVKAEPVSERSDGKIRPRFLLTPIVGGK